MVSKWRAPIAQTGDRGFPLPEDNELILGKVILTGCDRQLAGVPGLQPVDGFVGYVRAMWAAQEYQTEREPTILADESDFVPPDR